MQDFRTVEITVKRVVKELNAEDPNWSWKADVLKNKIRVWWGYLQYCNNEDSHFTIEMGTKEEGNTQNDFVVARNERNEYMGGALLGDKFYSDGNLDKCVEILLRKIAHKAHNQY